jgi:hyperosmotically inducible periplasmic protein
MLRRLGNHLVGGLNMLKQVMTALFVAGATLAPAASHATGTSGTHAGAANAQSNTTTGGSRMGAAADSRSTTERASDTLGDATITTKVKSKFAADSDVSALAINVDTDNGVVKLSGTAKSQDEARKAVQIARNTEGVKSVDNKIRVGASGTKY